MTDQLYTLLIINKSGGLIYNKDLGGTQSKLDVNELLQLASVWHSMHAISSQLSPVPGCTGMEVLEADNFTLYCLQSLTGTKFILIASPRAEGVQSLLQRVYELYCDYALKNPFYEMEMPIRCRLFDEGLHHLLVNPQGHP